MADVDSHNSRRIPTAMSPSDAMPAAGDLGTPPTDEGADASFEALRHFHDARRHSLFPVAPLNRKLSTLTHDALDAALRGGAGGAGATVFDEADEIGSESGDVGKAVGLTPAEQRFEALKQQYGDGFGLAVTLDEEADLGSAINNVGVPPFEPYQPSVSFEVPTSPVRSLHTHRRQGSGSGSGSGKIKPSPKATSPSSGSKFSPIAFRIGSSKRNATSPGNRARASQNGHGGTGGARTLYGGPVPPAPAEKPLKPAGGRHARTATPVAHMGFSAKTGMREPYMGVSLPDDLPIDGGASSPEELGSIPDMLRRASGAGLHNLGNLLSRIEHEDTHPSPNLGGKGHKTKTSIDWRKRLLALDMAPPLPENAAAPQYTISLNRASVADNEKFDKDDDERSPGSIHISLPVLEKDAGWKERQSMDMKVDTKGSGIIHVGNPHKADNARTRARLAAGMVTSFMSLVATVVYLAFRIKYTVTTIHEFGPNYQSACVFLAIECVLSLSLALAAVHSVLAHKRNLTPRLRMRGEDNLPIVDLCILAGGFSDAVVMDTVAATLSLDYPTSRYRVLVIDNGDGGRDLQRRVEMFRQSRPMNLTFHKVAWDHSDRLAAHARGNAIKFALNQRNGRGPGPFVAVLDGDMIPELSFLRALVPHIVNDPFVGMVTCPAAVYNLPQKLGQATSTFVNCTTNADGCRSGILLRRSALTDIGGYPAFSTSDDNAAKTLLAGKGYATVHLAEAVQCGTVPLSYRDGIRHAKDLRLAPLRLACRAGFFFGRAGAGLDAFTRIRKVAASFKPFFSVAVLFAMVSYPILFGLGGILVAASDVGQLNVLLQSAFAVVFLSRLHELVWCPPTRTISSRRRLQAWAFMAPYELTALFTALIPRSANRPAPVETRERDTAPADESRLARVAKTVIFHGAWTHMLLLCGTLAALGISLHATIEANLSGTYTLYQTGLAALLTVFWPTLYYFDILIGLATPVAYACFPPTPAFREELILRDQYTAVARPRHDKRSTPPFRVRRATEIIISTLLASWALALFFLTFITVPHK